MFYNAWENLLSESDIIDIVLGKFNTDILNSTNISLQIYIAGKCNHSPKCFPDSSCIFK